MVGEGDLLVDEIIDKCVETMKRSEACEISFQYAHPTDYHKSQDKDTHSELNPAKTVSSTSEPDEGICTEIFERL